MVVQTNNRVAGLDGLRGLACLAVFVEHFHHKTQLDGQLWQFNLSKLMVSGWGVAILFILSGFVLSIPYWEALKCRGARPGIFSFWFRRLARLTPAYFLCLTALVIHNQLWEYTDQRNDILLHYLFLFNYAHHSFYSINPPFWAIGIIAQFYLILPFIFLAVRNRKDSTAFLMIAALSISVYITHYYFMAHVHELAYWPFSSDSIPSNSPVLTHSILAHLPHFLIGVLGAYIYLSKLHNKSTTAREFRYSYDAVFWIATAGVLIILSSPLDQILQVPYGRYNLPYVPILLVIMILSAPIAPLANRFLESRLILFTGTISYGIYVYHYPIMNLTSRYLGKLNISTKEHWLIFAITSLLITVIVSSISYYLVERPILRASRKLTSSNPRRMDSLNN